MMAMRQEGGRSEQHYFDTIPMTINYRKDGRSDKALYFYPVVEVDMSKCGGKEQPRASPKLALIPPEPESGNCAASEPDSLVDRRGRAERTTR